MFLYLRSTLYMVFLIFSTMVIALILILLKWIAPYHILARIGKFWGQINLKALDIFCGLTYRIHGWHNLPRETCIVLSKHQSAWETIALRGLLPPCNAWVIKRELLWIPFFGWGMSALDPIALDRKSGSLAIKRLLREGKKRLDSGRWVVIFPEGTRVATGQRIKYNVGGALLGEKTGYPILPIAHNAGIFWGRRGFIKYPGVIDLVIGEIINTHGLKATEINQQIEDWIEGTVVRLQNSR